MRSIIFLFLAGFYMFLATPVFAVKANTADYEAWLKTHPEQVQVAQLKAQIGDAVKRGDKSRAKELQAQFMTMQNRRIEEMQATHKPHGSKAGSGALQLTKEQEAKRQEWLKAHPEAAQIDQLRGQRNDAIRNHDEIKAQQITAQMRLLAKQSKH